MDEAWDYIIVGAGSAGSVLAARLSEDDAARVLLLEAGRNYRTFETPWQFRGRDTALAMPPDPSDTGRQEFGTYFWQGIPARRNSHQEIRPYVRGRGVGGCSAVNGVIALRAMSEDFAVWRAMGADGWGWEDIVPAYVRLESDADYAGSPGHGSSGPIPVYREPEAGWGGTDRALWESADAAGYGYVDDANREDSTGISRFPMNIRSGRRVSTNDGYLEPARDRANLSIRGNAHVAKLVFGPTTRRVSGVQLIDGETIRVHPDGEVILAAGAVHSPAILMRSGIGPANALRGLGIDVVGDLPVGEGAQDHAMLNIDYEADEDARRSAGNRHTNVIVRYTSGIGESGTNDMMLVANNHNASAGQPLTAGITVQLNEIDSRGRLTLRSDDPAVEPLVELNLLESGSDLERMMDGIDRARQLAEHPEFRRIAKSPLMFPADADAVRRAVVDIFHICSTARMGHRGDETTVVTPDCRVLGVDGLRVVDASVMPRIVRSNINLTVIALAERMAGILRADRGSSSLAEDLA